MPWLELNPNIALQNISRNPLWLTPLAIRGQQLQFLRIASEGCDGGLQRKMHQLLENLSGNGLGFLVAVGLSWLIWTILLPKHQYKGELFNDRTQFEWLYIKARRRFLESGGVILNNAFKKVKYTDLLIPPDKR